jgi:RNA polymerase sigma-70 factor (ECF subfamily)
MPQKNPNETDDKEIVGQAIAGQNGAFAELVHKYSAFALAIVKKHVPLDDAEDVMQDIFLRVYRSLPTFNNQSSFRSWLSVIAVRTCYDFWRKRYKSKTFPISSLSDENQRWVNEALSNTYIYEKGAQREAREVLDWALSKLPAGDRMVLELVYLEDKSLKEAAELLGFSVANIKVKLFRSRRKIHKLLESIRED